MAVGVFSIIMAIGFVIILAGFLAGLGTLQSTILLIIGFIVAMAGIIGEVVKSAYKLDKPFPF